MSEEIVPPGEQCADAGPNSPRSPGLRYIYGKRRDRKGYDVIVVGGDRAALFGPFRLQREARRAISLGELGEPYEIHEAAREGTRVAAQVSQPIREDR